MDWGRTSRAASRTVRRSTLSLPLGVGAEQGPVAEGVDESRHAARQAMHVPERAGVEDFPAAAGQRQPVPHIGVRIGLGQGQQVVARRDALGQLVQLLAGQALDQLGLSDQDDLQELLLLGLQIREQAELLERADAQVLGFVHDQDRTALVGVSRQQMAPEGVDERLPTGRGRLVLRAQLVADGGQQLLGREQRIEDQRDVDALGEPIEEQAAYGRLAGPDLAGELDEAAVLLDAVEQMGERLLVTRAQVDEARVGRIRERSLAETEVRDVHR